jgi:hypothetical protein
MQKKSLSVLMVRYKMARHIFNKWNSKLQGLVTETSSLKSTKLSAAKTVHFIQSVYFTHRHCKVIDAKLSLMP